MLELNDDFRIASLFFRSGSVFSVDVDYHYATIARSWRRRQSLRKPLGRKRRGSPLLITPALFLPSLNLVNYKRIERSSFSRRNAISRWNASTQALQSFEGVDWTRGCLPQSVSTRVSTRNNLAHEHIMHFQVFKRRLWEMLCMGITRKGRVMSLFKYC